MVTIAGWGAGPWGSSPWGAGASSTPVPPTPPTPVITIGQNSLSDTVYGGGPISIGANIPLYDTSQDFIFIGQSDPVGWTPTVTGSGQVLPTVAGLLLQSGVTPSSAATISSGSTYDAFEANLTFKVKSPSRSPNLTATILNFSFVTTDGESVSILVQKSSKLDLSQIYVSTLTTLSDDVVPGGGVFLDDGEDITLTITRYLNYAFLWVSVGTDPAILLYKTDRFSSAKGKFTLSTANGAQSTKTSCLVKSLTFRSQALIVGNLITNKVNFSQRRITGQIPRASGFLADVGLHDIIVFGLWGSATLSQVFRYIYPDGLTFSLTSDSVSSPIIFSDPTVRD